MQCPTSACVEVLLQIITLNFLSVIVIVTIMIMTTPPVCPGLIRYLIVCLDCSVHAKDTDHRPNRLESSKAAVERFMREYFDQNPISQVGEFGSLMQSSLC